MRTRYDVTLMSGNLITRCRQFIIKNQDGTWYDENTAMTFSSENDIYQYYGKNDILVILTPVEEMRICGHSL
jgi:hypothetical protein